MSETILTKKLRDGRTATVTIKKERGVVSVTSWLDGKELGNHCGPHHLRPNLPPGHVAAVGKLALTQQEADQVKSAYDKFVADLPRDLHAERRALVATLMEAQDRASDARSAEWERFDQGEQPTGLHNPAGEAAIQQARVALAAFDGEYPEIVAELQVQRARDVERWATL